MTLCNQCGGCGQVVDGTEVVDPSTHVKNDAKGKPAGQCAQCLGKGWIP